MDILELGGHKTEAITFCGVKKKSTLPSLTALLRKCWQPVWLAGHSYWKMFLWLRARACQQAC